MPRHVGRWRRGLPEILEEGSNELTAFSRRLFVSLYDELVDLEGKSEASEEQVKAVYQTSEPWQRVAAVERIGPVSATTLVAPMSDGKTFRSGSQFAACLGLVPRQHSNGGKPQLFGITKRGDPSAHSVRSRSTLGHLSGRG